MPSELFSLSSLDSIMQIGVAFLLAYLNLGVFRYRKDAQVIASEALRKAREDSGLNNIKEYTAYKELKQQHNYLGNISKDKCKFSVVNTLDTNIAIKILVGYFCNNIDRWLSMVFFIILTAFLIIDTKYFIDCYEYLNKSPNLLFWLVMLFSFFPIINILLGRIMKNGLTSIVNVYKQDLNKAIEILKEAEKRMIINMPDNFNKHE